MTRPMTKAELSLMALPQSQGDLLVRFLINNMVLGAGIGIGVATFILLTDTSDFSRSSRASPIRSPQRSHSLSVAS